MSWFLPLLHLIALIGLYFSVLYGYRRARRDFFAAQALSGLVVNGDNFDLPRLTAYSYEMADAMLKARDA
jgi:hypothetical protein